MKDPILACQERVVERSNDRVSQLAERKEGWSIRQLAEMIG